MSVESILKRKGSEVVRTSPEATIKSAADEMRQRGIAALIVVASGDDIAGIISEREIVDGLSRHGERLSAMTVGEIMRRDVYTLSPEDHVTRAMALMTRHRVRHLPVIQEGRLVGVISIGDAVKNRLDDLEIETRVLRDLYVAAR